jgi:hypothetical protein
MADASKDTIYIDIDDEITTIIDKLKSSDKKIVALVLPKRAAVLQSVVNMKLLKRTADDSKKSLVLITSEAGVLPLAGVVGVHVAKTLQSKPAIPLAPKAETAALAVSADEIEDKELDASKPIGELADDEPIEVDNEDKVETGAAAAGVAKKAKGKGKRIKIPNFDKFRLKVVAGIAALIVLLVGLYFATQVLPKARVVIKTDSTSIDTELKTTVSPTATEVSEDGSVVPGTLKEVKKTDTETVPTTGQIDKGEKAKGTVTLRNCSASVDAVTIPAGTGVSNSNLTFFTNEAVVLPATTKNGLNQCTTATKDVAVTAQAGGDKYNLSGGRTFTVAGYSSVNGVDSSAMSGGTSNIVKIVAQKDIDDARQKIADRSDAARDELLEDMEAEGYIGLRETFATKGEPVVTSSPKVNEEGANVTVKVETTYTLLGVKEDDLSGLVEKSAEGKYDKEKQVILDDGLDDARIVQDEKKPNGEVAITIRTQVLAGPQLDEEAIKKEIAGKKKSQSISAIQSRPAIKEAQISYSPFWVSSTPKKTSKITVVFEQSNTPENNDE